MTLPEQEHVSHLRYLAFEVIPAVIEFLADDDGFQTCKSWTVPQRVVDILVILEVDQFLDRPLPRQLDSTFKGYADNLPSFTSFTASFLQQRLETDGRPTGVSRIPPWEIIRLGRQLVFRLCLPNTILGPRMRRQTFDKAGKIDYQVVHDRRDKLEGDLRVRASGGRASRYTVVKGSSDPVTRTQIEVRC
jgi:hypothetical protein